MVTSALDATAVFTAPRRRVREQVLDVGTAVPSRGGGEAEIPLLEATAASCSSPVTSRASRMSMILARSGPTRAFSSLEIFVGGGRADDRDDRTCVRFAVRARTRAVTMEAVPPVPALAGRYRCGLLDSVR